VHNGSHDPGLRAVTCASVRPWLLAVIQEVCYAPRGSSINIGGPGRDGEWISGSSDRARQLPARGVVVVG